VALVPAAWTIEAAAAAAAEVLTVEVVIEAEFPNI